ncbi:hypothetical protein [Metabacillus fastidiosus]|uniref:hypothetical protein n=2 Tax=Metabacillus fastidiosus TaxID=1458 RepID=UPI0008259982|nr:hypothetical protein [Metabacillus fastidiosus]MED4462233.1 hypothetical protein [Metabacillus fastidiosus]
MGRIIIVFISSCLLLGISFSPMFSIIREFWIDKKVTVRYEIHQVYQEYGSESHLDVQELMIDNKNIKIEEEQTGRKAPSTYWEETENIEPGDIVKLHFFLNDKEISTSDEIWLSNKDEGSSYFSWLGIFNVYDRKTGEKQIKIIQRLTEITMINESMEGIKWKIISIREDGKVNEKILSYPHRSDDPLAVQLINYATISPMGIGYYSDITKGYVTYFFPLFYPVFTTLFGLILLIIVLILVYKRRK